MTFHLILNAYHILILVILFVTVLSVSFPYADDGAGDDSLLYANPNPNPKLMSGAESLLAFNSPNSYSSLNLNGDASFDSDSDLLFGGVDNDVDNNDFLSPFSNNALIDLDSPSSSMFQLADAACSSSSELQELPAIGISRIKRGVPLNCPNSGAPPLTGIGPLQSDLNFNHKTWGEKTPYEIWTDGLVEQRKNEVCSRITAGALPWGVCYYRYGPWDPMYNTMAPPTIGGITFPAFYLDICELARGERNDCPQEQTPWEFYCCMMYYPKPSKESLTSLYVASTGEGYVCVPLPMLASSIK